MKRFATKAVAVVLAVVFVMSFAACSGGNKTDDPAQTSGSTATEAVSTEAATTAASEKALISV